MLVERSKVLSLFIGSSGSEQKSVSFKKIQNFVKKTQYGLTLKAFYSEDRERIFVQVLTLEKIP